MSSPRLILKKIIPKSFRQVIWDHIRAPLNLARHQMRDAVRFYRHNLRSNIGKQTCRQAMMYSHMLEKGLSMRDFRPFFGKDVVTALPDFIHALDERLPFSHDAAAIARSVLEAYEKRHEALDKNSTDQEFLSNLKAKFKNPSSPNVSAPNLGGVTHLDKEHLKKAASNGVREALRARHSIRMYEQTSISSDVINDCLESASRSPSACNLQPTRIYVVQNQPKIQQLLNIQGGARGFYSEVPLLFILTYDLAFQIGPRSRMQGYTDTGLFAQSLMLALLEKGIGSCPLNWGQEIETDQNLRKAAGISESENIVMLVSAGNLPDSIQCAKSSRFPVCDRVTYLS